MQVLSAPQLTYLEIGDNTYNQVTSFPFDNLHSLQRLVVRASTTIDEIWKDAPFQLANLTSLELTSKRLTIDGIKELATVAGGLPGLQKFSLQCMQYPTWRKGANLGESLTNLKR